jgi:hypothetical protein
MLMDYNTRPLLCLKLSIRSTASNSHLRVGIQDAFKEVRQHGESAFCHSAE